MVGNLCLFDEGGSSVVTGKEVLIRLRVIVLFFLVLRIVVAGFCFLVGTPILSKQYCIKTADLHGLKTHVYLLADFALIWCQSFLQRVVDESKRLSVFVFLAKIELEVKVVARVGTFALGRVFLIGQHGKPPTQISFRIFDYFLFDWFSLRCRVGRRRHSTAPFSG